MTILEIATEMTIDFQEQVQHYVCCEIPDSFCGVTTTFCGKKVVEDLAAEKESLVVCSQCIEVAQRPGCPLGHDCEPVE